MLKNSFKKKKQVINTNKKGAAEIPIHLFIPL